MKIGKLRNVVEIQELTETRSEFGEVLKSWETTSCPWASVMPLSGQELEIARQINNQISHAVVIRFQEISTTNRILFKGRTLEILSILNTEERDRELHIFCKEVT